MIGSNCALPGHELGKDNSIDLKFQGFKHVLLKFGGVISVNSKKYQGSIHRPWREFKGGSCLHFIFSSDGIFKIDNYCVTLTFERFGDASGLICRDKEKCC